MTRTDVMAAVRAVDPYDDNDDWSQTPAGVALLDRVLTTPGDTPVALSRARHASRPVRIGAAVVVLAGAGTATAYATGILGGPAPDRVKAHLRGLDAGMPADLRYNADVDNARAVATTDAGALYLADIPDGGYCLEVASDTDRPRGATCLTSADLAALPLEVTAPIPDSESSVLLIGGRANDASIRSLRATFADGTSVDIGFGLDRAWLLEVAPAQHAAALDHGVRITAFDNDGHVVTATRVPPLHDNDPLGTAHDNDQPIVANTVSDGGDFTLVLAINGQVNLPGDVLLALHYPDGSSVAVPLAANGHFHVAIPDDRRNAFASRPGELVASRDGKVIATTPVASVAWWRGHNG